MARNPEGVNYEEELETMSDLWKNATLDVLDSYRRMIDGALKQLSDEELHRRPTEGINSIAVILRHLGGNLLSRWTDFLTTDGEKPTRNRDSEFEVTVQDKATILQKWNEGWDCFFTTFDTLKADQLSEIVYIRNEGHTVIEAISRHLAHS